LRGNQKQNSFKQQYLSSKTNYVLVLIDIIKLGIQYGSYFSVLDVATCNNMVGHCYKTMTPDLQDFLDCISEIIEKRSFLPKIHIINLDLESYFKNEEYYQFFEQYRIATS